MNFITVQNIGLYLLKKSQINVSVNNKATN